MSNVNVASRRSKADDANALAAAKQAAAGEGLKTVTEDGKTYIVETNAAGMTIKSRIA